jgi:tetratricopeptide (TPR) repeat protein
MASMVRTLLFAIIAFFALARGVPHADEPSASRRAFVSGMKHFDLGEFKEALSDFKDGYRAKEDPVFLFNIAQCYRAMSEQRDALRYYRLYLSRSPDAPNRNEVEHRIVDLETAIAAGKTGTTTEAPVPSTEKKQAAPASSAANPAQAAIAHGEEPMLHATAPRNKPPQPVYKKWWLWTLVGVAAAGAAVGIGVGVTEANHPAAGTTFPTGAF